MKAVIHHKYGSPGELQLATIEKPVPKDNEVLVRIVSTTVTAGDCELRAMKIAFPLNIPMRFFVNRKFPNGKILGQEMAGVIEDLGDGVTQFKRGQRIFGATLFRFGCYAEYICLPDSHPLLGIPEGLSFEETATIPTGGLNALHFLNKARVKKGDNLLINGAGGSIGTYCIQLAKQRGAHITAVDSEEKFGLLRELGAHKVIDYQKGDFWQSAAQYDAIIDIVGTAKLKGLRVVQKKGRYVMGNPRLGLVFAATWRNLLGGKKIAFKPADYEKKDMQHLLNLMVGGEIKAAIDKRLPLEEIKKAHEYVESGKKLGNLIININ